MEVAGYVPDLLLGFDDTLIFMFTVSKIKLRIWIFLFIK